ncbi:MAG: hypothetical protein IKL10_10855 [Clostridia bacterium]|nr:hypothetical protein [Bacilli bacterium]MBR3768719.1 hypothetical protein [Clostridia bacterium]
MKQEMYLSLLDELRGKTIILVYSFRGEQEEGLKQYDAWKSDVISDWLSAIEEIGCLPLIMDVRTFVFKAMNNSLPQTDFVVNLCNGTISLSTLGLVPATCGFLNIPCIPCNAYVSLVGENKHYSNLIARAKGMNVPRDLNINDNGGIFRPIGFGSSKGVVKNPSQEHINTYRSYVYQEFINGFDITTPIMYNPLSEQLEVMPAVVYYPNSKDNSWFLGEEEKSKHMGYEKICVNLSDEAKCYYINMAKSLLVDTYCRIDARIKCKSISELIDRKNRPIEHSELFFLEINPMPTIKKNINFHTSLSSLTDEYNMKNCWDLYSSQIQNATLTGLILSNSIMAYFKAKH